MPRLALCLVASCLAVASPAPLSAAPAAESKNLQTLMTVRGKELLADDFAKPELDPRWKPAKGKWEVKEGVLRGTEVAADMHAATVRTDLPHGDAVYQFDFRFEPGGKAVHLSLNGAPGHIGRVTITPGGFQLRKDASKKDPADKGVVLDSCKMTFEPGKWYTMVVEVSGPEMLARVDDRHYALGGDAKLATAKTNFGFPASGDGVSLDNVKVWAATANPEWPQAKQKLTADHPEKMQAPARPGKKKQPAAPAAAAKGEAAVTCEGAAK